MAPRSSAASKVLLSSWVSLGMTDSITYGMLKVICAKSSDTNPSLSPIKVKSSKSEIPVTISALTIGSEVTFISTFRMRFLE